jgi:hypothetical protein
MKLETFSFSPPSGWAAEPTPEFNSPNIVAVVLGAPALTDVQVRLPQLVATYSQTHVVAAAAA